MKFIGLDIGTTTLCGIALDAATGAAVEAVTVANDAAQQSPNPWERLQDPDRIVDTVRGILDRLLGNHPDVRGVGVTGQMHGILHVNRDGRAASPLFTWQDGRGELDGGGGISFARRLSELAGHPLSTGYGLVTHFWHIANRALPPDAVALCTIGDYVVMRLAGLDRPRMDPTNAASLGLFDMQRTAFDRPALERATLDAAFLPEVVPSGTPAGEAAPGIPVVVALGDNPASFLGAVRDVARTTLVNVGTGGQVTAFSPEFIQAPGLETRPFPGAGYILVGASLCGGRAYTLLADFFRITCARFAGRDDMDVYGIMNAIGAEALNQPNGPRVDTRFAGTREAPDIRGAVTNLSVDNFTPGRLVAGLLDGMAEELHGFFRRMPASIRERTDTLAGAGNGIRENPLLRRILGERFGRPVRVPACREEAAAGAALCAAVGTGALRSFREAGAALRYKEIIP
ncbi:MAG: FGGY family carbohydrate kinase [Planctomycetota bacterium]